MGAMDLAICWDYRPCDPRDEPKPPVHIDGSDGSAAPAVFTMVRTPRTPQPTGGDQVDPGATGRSGGVFANTLGQENFFDKDLLRRNTDFGGCKPSASDRVCDCGNPESAWKRTQTRIRSTSTNDCAQQRPKSVVARDGTARTRMEDLKLERTRYQSSPNLSRLVDEEPADRNGNGGCQLVCINHRTEVAPDHQHKHHHQRHASQPNLARVKTARLCQRVVKEPAESMHQAPKIEYKPFRVGVPNSNAAGTCTSFDSGCSSMSSCSSQRNKLPQQQQQQQPLKVPKPRDPYARKNYSIDSLAPPFACWRGGAGQGGYPEHWRLSSVYQQAFKPIDQRKRPLLATVFQ